TPRRPTPRSWPTSSSPRTSMRSWSGCCAETARTTPTTGRPRTTVPPMIRAGDRRPDTRTALAELSAAVSPARQDYLELLRSSPRALHREGGPRHLTASAVVIDAPAEHV